MQILAEIEVRNDQLSLGQCVITCYDDDQNHLQMFDYACVVDRKSHSFSQLDCRDAGGCHGLKPKLTA